MSNEDDSTKKKVAELANRPTADASEPVEEAQPEEHQALARAEQQSAMDSPERGIGSRIALARERLGLTQTKLAERTKRTDPESRGVPRTVLIGYETGKHLPGARELRVLCHALDVEVTWLLYGTEDSTTEDIERAAATRLLRFPGLDLQFELALTIARLKRHEQEAISTLIHGIVSRSNRSEEEAEAITSISREITNLVIGLFWRATGRETAMSDFMANLVLGREIKSFAAALKELTTEMALSDPNEQPKKQKKGKQSS